MSGRGFNSVKQSEWRSEVSKQNSYDFFEKIGESDTQEIKDAKQRFKRPAYTIERVFSNGHDR